MVLGPDEWEIAEIVSQDPGFQKNHKRLCVTLGDSDIEADNLKFEPRNTYFEIFSDIMNQWHSKNGRKANTAKLIEVLTAIEVVSSINTIAELPDNTKVTHWSLIRILEKDYRLCKQLLLFCEALKLGEGNIFAIKNKIKSEPSFENLVRSMLQIWKSKNGSEATLQKLSNIFSQLGLESCHELLEDHIKELPATQVDSEKVVSILSDVTDFRIKWIPVSNKLGLTQSEIYDLERQMMSQQDCFEVSVYQLLQRWKSRKGNEANLSTLVDHLGDAGLKDLKEKILQKKIESQQFQLPVLVPGDQIIIEENETNRSYDSVFGSYLTKKIKKIVLNDTYVRTPYQIENFGHFVDLVIKNCYDEKRELKTEFVLNTTKGKNNQKEIEQRERLESFIPKLYESNITFTLNILEDGAFHDRSLILDSRKIVLGRGLDYYHRYDAGVPERLNLDERKCKATEITVARA